jgi:PAS domain S-box-containing protein
MKNYLGDDVLDNLLEGFQLISYDWEYLYVNDVVAKQGKSTKEKLIGKTMMEMYPGIEDTDMFKTLQFCMEKRIPRQMENEFTYPDGSKAWFQLNIEPVPDGIFILSLDISDRKKIIKQLTGLVEAHKEKNKPDNDLESILSICTML